MAVKLVTASLADGGSGKSTKTTTTSTANTKTTRPDKSYLSYDPKTGKWVPDANNVKVASTTTSSTKNTTPSTKKTGTASSNFDSKKDSDKEYIEAEFNVLTGEMRLTPTSKSIRIRVNDTVKIDGLGKYLSGLYFVSAISRKVSISDGYTHTLQLIKNGFGESVKTIFDETTTRKEEVPKTVEEPKKPATSTPAKSHKARFTDTDSTYLDYWVHLPKNLSDNMPLVIFLHGIGEVGLIDSLKNYGLISRARDIYGDSFPFVALYPNTHIQSWTLKGVPNTLIHLIDYIADKYSIDKDRIILTGHSLGAYGVWSIVNKYKDYFSCAVPVSGDPQETLTYSNFENVPIRAMCGTGDAYERAYSTGMQTVVDGINSNGGNAHYVSLTGKTHGQTKDSAYTRETFEWMLSQ